MPGFIFPPAEVPSLSVRGTTDRFPVRRIFCLGLNYADHAQEMGKNIGLAKAKDLLFFTKPADSVCTDDFPYPSGTDDCHFEVELVVALHKGGRDLAVTTARDSIFGYAVGIDMTKRDVQSKAKQAGHPWDMAKGFDHSAPMSELVPASEIGHPRAGAIWLKQNGAVRQSGDLQDMITSPEETIVQLSKLVELKAGDLIFTGTPSGVGPCVRDDELEAGIDGVGSLHIRVV